jgi:hypothetical protein
MFAIIPILLSLHENTLLPTETTLRSRAEITNLRARPTPLETLAALP